MGRSLTGFPTHVIDRFHWQIIAYLSVLLAFNLLYIVLIPLDARARACYNPTHVCRART